MRRSGIGLTEVLLLVGCSIPPPAAEIREKDDPFSPQKQIATGFVRVPSETATVGLQLVAEVDRATKVAKAIARVQLLYVAAHGRKYDVARNDRAEQLPLTVQATKGRCGLGNQCPHEEIVAVSIAITELRRGAADGYRLSLIHI